MAETMAGMRAGENVLAIQGLNVNLESSDFSLIPVLEGTIAAEPRAGANEMVENFRRSAAASDPRLSYLEGRELAQEGRHREAAERFMDAIRTDWTQVEPYRRRQVDVLLRQDESPELAAPPFTGLSPARYALEVSGGFIEDHGPASGWTLVRGGANE